MIHLTKSFEKHFYRLFKNPLTFVLSIVAFILFVIFIPQVIPHPYWKYWIYTISIFVLLLSIFTLVAQIQDIYIIIKSRPKNWKPAYCKECGHRLTEKENE